MLRYGSVVFGTHHDNTSSRTNPTGANKGKTTVARTLLDYFTHHRIRASASTPKHPAARFRRYERDHQKTRSVTRGMSAMSTPRGEPRHSSDTGVAGKNDDPL